jgi:hypothetical protein
MKLLPFGNEKDPKVPCLMDSFLKSFCFLLGTIGPIYLVTKNIVITSIKCKISFKIENINKKSRP